MTCDGGTCYAGCTCSESAWAEKLAAAEREARINAEYGHTAALRMNRIRQVIGDTTRDGFEYSAAEIARTVLAECDMPMEPELRRLIAAEERAKASDMALQSLTPGGSEFVNDPQACVRFVRDFRDGQHAQILKLTRERRAAEERAEEATTRAIKAIEEKNVALAQNVAIRSLHMENGTMDAAVAGDFAKFFAVALTQFFRDSGGENYVEMGVDSSDGKDRFIVHVQRVAGQTPHQLRLAAESALAAAEARIRGLEEAAAALVRKIDEVDESPEYRCVWGLFWSRGYEYKGPRFEEELNALKVALYPELAPLLTPPPEAEKRGEE